MYTRLLAAALLFLFTSQLFAAKEPKGVVSARKSVASVLVYKDGVLLRSGIGVFVGSAGELLSSYSLFVDADSAVVIDVDGKVRPVKRVLGANELYDCIKFNVEWDKKIKPLQLTTEEIAKGTLLYMVSYGRKSSGTIDRLNISSIEKIGNSAYYSFTYKMQEKNISAPVVNERGELVALMQSSAPGDTINSYALSATMPAELSLTTLSYSNPVYDRIFIPRALPQDRNDALTLLYLLQSYSHGEERDKFILPLADYMKAYPESYEGHLLYAEYHALINGSFVEAHNSWKQALKVTGKPDDVYFNMSKVYTTAAGMASTDEQQAERIDTAIMYIENAMSHSREPIYIKQYAELLYAKGLYEKSLECYKELTATNLVEPGIYYSAAVCLELMERFDEAICYADTAVAMSEQLPGGADILYARAQMKHRVGLHREAVLDYNKYADKMGENLDALFYFNREQAEYDAKMFQQAIDDIDKAIALQPGLPMFYIEKGRLCYRVKLFDVAVEALAKAAEMDNDNADTHYLIARCYMAAKDYESAKVSMTKAKELGHFDADAKLGEINTLLAK